MKKWPIADWNIKRFMLFVTNSSSLDRLILVFYKFVDDTNYFFNKFYFKIWCGKTKNYGMFHCGFWKNVRDISTFIYNTFIFKFQSENPFLFNFQSVTNFFFFVIKCYWYARVINAKDVEIESYKVSGIEKLEVYSRSRFAMLLQHFFIS